MKTTDNEENLYDSFCFFYYSCVGIGDDGLQVITDGCRKLTNLNLSFCKRITDKGMEHVSHLANLYYLDLCGLSSITHMGIKSVAMGCKRLTVLSLKHCNNIDDSGFSFLAFCARTLQKVSDRLPHMCLLSHFSFHYFDTLPLQFWFLFVFLCIAVSHLIYLLTLKWRRICSQKLFPPVKNYNFGNFQINLSYCDKLSDKGLLDLMSNLKHLQHIKLVQVRGVSFTGLKNLLIVCCGQPKKVQMGQDLNRSKEWKAQLDDDRERKLREGGFKRNRCDDDDVSDEYNI